MWNRKELKAKGKAAFYTNRVTCIIAALLLAIAGGVGGYIAPVNFNSAGNNDQAYEMEDDAAYDYEDLETEEELVDEYEDITATEDEVDPFVILKTATIILAVIMVIILILSIILFNPLNVAMRKFFIDNSSDPGTGISRKNLGIGFGENWKNIVGAMFMKDLFMLLWSLLLVIPGIYKAYCWRMVPFIMSENPEISGKEARALSAKMMNGSKWASFVLDLSFLGWRILAIFTLGILNLLFTNPYQACTEAELYLALKQRSMTEEEAESNDVVDLEVEQTETDDQTFEELK